MNEDECKKRGIKALGKIIDYADAGVEPVDFTVAPTEAVKKLFERNKLSASDIDY